MLTSLLVMNSRQVLINLASAPLMDQVEGFLPLLAIRLEQFSKAYREALHRFEDLAIRIYNENGLPKRFATGHQFP